MKHNGVWVVNLSSEGDGINLVYHPHFIGEETEAGREEMTQIKVPIMCNLDQIPMVLFFLHE